MKHKKWILKHQDKQKVRQLEKEAAGYKDFLYNIFISRGLDTAETLNTYFNPDYSMLHDPYLMKDMDKAVDRILKAIRQKEQILVFGDYDVDGTTGVALLVKFLKEIYPDNRIDYYIPDRRNEGYGISTQGIEYAKSLGTSLFISVDCGIKAVNEAGEIHNAGMDLIICDHHLPGEELPHSVAILDPQQPGCSYPYKELSGCGVAFKLITALAKELSLPEKAVYKYLDLVTTSTGADVVPITGENRLLCQFGLKILNDNPSTGLKAIIKTLGNNAPLTMYSIGFLIGPRINAAGRLDHAKMVVELLLEEEFDKAIILASKLHAYNEERKNLEETTTKEALEILRRNPDVAQKKTTVVYNDHWNKGVIGIVASRLTDYYYRPTIVLTQENGLITGSARSVSGFDLHRAIADCSMYLEKFGGHTAAAGLSLLPENLQPFSEHFESVVSETITEEILTSKVYIDSVIDLKDVNFNLFKTVEAMAPFGQDNPKPVFATLGVRPSNWTKILKEKHISFHFYDEDGTGIRGIGFNQADKYRRLEQNALIDIAYTIDENEWEGTKSLQLKIVDFRIAAPL
ncbi:MAG: single-stranded-DNA-specific exonuclease RecJ [Chitinophagaceae bacterium]|nr:single-stranded-DNA-specific exonuclease RecJ [Chitinophagaceae bacterium]